MKLHPFWQQFPAIQASLSGVCSHIKTVLDDTPELIREDLGLLLSNPGKMLRPAFVILSAAAGEKESENLLPVAAAVELLHSASLIHDDIIDNSPQRRGRPTLHSRTGIKRAVLAGDYLLAKSLQLASAAHNDGIIESVNNSVEKLCLSEIEQDSRMGNLFISRETYYSRIEGKTAALFALSCRTGAVLGGAEDDICAQLDEAGKNFGLAFQIFDDIIDYAGNVSTAGKPTGNDLKDGIATLPLILALEERNKKIEKLCRSAGRRSARKRIRNEIVNGGYLNRASSIGDEYLEKSVGLLKKTGIKNSELFIFIIKELRKIYELD